MYKISAISYLNTVPFIYGLMNTQIKEIIDLNLDYPSNCADHLINGSVDLALVPVSIIPFLNESNIISNYCIGADGPVETVCLYSEIPIQNIKKISLDYQSKTSVALLKLLLKDFWCLSPKLIMAEPDFEKNIKGAHAALVIGDRAFELNKKYQYIYDLSSSWKEMTGLPFVFATWVSVRKLPLDFISQFNRALALGLSNIDNALKNNAYFNFKFKNPREYLNSKISYTLDEKKMDGMNLFLKKISE